jgi:hypothetical protein
MVVLNIPDDYDFMDPARIQLLKQRCTPIFLERYHHALVIAKQKQRRPQESLVIATWTACSLLPLWFRSLLR